MFELINKLDKVTDMMRQAGMDLLLIGTGTDLEYLTGLSSRECERFKSLAIVSDGRHFFICPELYYEETREALGEDEMIFVWSDSDGFLKAIKDANRVYQLEGMNIGVSDVIRAIDMLDIKDVMEVNFLNGNEVLENVRLIKDADEIKWLKEASLMADRVCGEIISFIRPGLTEGDIANKIKEHFLEKGVTELSFEPIVASGPNSSRPHYNDDKRVIGETDIIILDFGCRYKGFCSDISRTVFVGKPTPEQEDIYRIVLQANSEAEKFARKGVTAGEVDRKARGIIREAGYGQYFLNRTGHGIGFAIHEAPYIREGNGVVLDNGMSFSVEPGIYIPGRFGMRIENIVLIENGESNVLNKFSKEMICV